MSAPSVRRIRSASPRHAARGCTRGILRKGRASHTPWSGSAWGRPGSPCARAATPRGSISGRIGTAGPPSR